MKIIFLDFDGVLTHQKSPRRNGLWWFDPACVERLNRLIDATGAKVVISSSWRIGHSLQSMHQFLTEAGYRHGIIGVTPQWATTAAGNVTGGFSSRGAEIVSWLDRSKETRGIKSFIILDDDCDMIHLAPRLIQTNYQVGLQDKDVDKAIELLTKTQLETI